MPLTDTEIRNAKPGRRPVKANRNDKKSPPLSDGNTKGKTPELAGMAYLWRDWRSRIRGSSANGPQLPRNSGISITVSPKYRLLLRRCDRICIDRSLF